jgi:hypothetical protein
MAARASARVRPAHLRARELRERQELVDRHAVVAVEGAVVVPACVRSAKAHGDGRRA